MSVANLPSTTLGVLLFCLTTAYSRSFCRCYSMPRESSRSHALRALQYQQKGSASCHVNADATHPYHPTPPPPPPPRLLTPTVAPSTVPPMKPWGREVEILVLGTVSCASVVFLLLTVIICYKAIKRKPLQKEENGTSRGEYAMSSRCKQQVVETNNTGV